MMLFNCVSFNIMRIKFVMMVVICNLVMLCLVMMFVRIIINVLVGLVICMCELLNREIIIFVMIVV